MTAGRWYPSQVTLPNGRVIVVSGNDDFGFYNYLTEVYDPITKSWSISYNPFGSNYIALGKTKLSKTGTPCFGGPNQSAAPGLGFYPRMFLMPSGLVYTSFIEIYLYMVDPSTGGWTLVGLSAFGQSEIMEPQSSSHFKIPLQREER